MVKSHPAEATGGLGAVGTAIALALGASTGLVAAIGIVAGGLPAVVTFVVNRGGVRGVLRLLWRGREVSDAG